MKLESEKYPAIENPSEEDISKSVALLGSRGNFYLILHSTKKGFISVEKSRTAWFVEYNTGSEDETFSCENKSITRDVILSMLNSYNRGSDEWLRNYNWKAQKIIKARELITKISKWCLALAIISGILFFIVIKVTHGPDNPINEKD